MKALFVANMNLHSTEGIYKKIISQAISLSKILGECYFIQRSNTGIIIRRFIDGTLNNETNQDGKFFEEIKKFLKNEKIDIVYVRLMLPSFKLISFLSFCKKNNYKLIYEIPTYPYFYEQFRTSKNRIKGLIKVGIHAFFFPLIYHIVDKMVAVISNSKIKILKKMVPINNGINLQLSSKKEDYSIKSTIKLIGVGTIYSYHGYDRLIQALKNCNEYAGGHIIETHFFGESDTLNELQEKVKTLGLNHVFFHGRIENKKLLKKYNDFDCGIGCLALHRRHADIDTTLKVVEFLNCGLPVLTSGNLLLNDDTLNEYTIKIENSNEIINMEEVINKLLNIYNKNELYSLPDKAKNIYNWDVVMKKIIDTINF